MQFERQDTLAWLYENTLVRAQRFQLPAKVAGAYLATINKQWGGNGEHPDLNAIRFYALHQLVAGLRTQYTPNQQLPEWAAEILSLYVKELRSQHQTLVWYTLLIIMRELRHLKSSSQFYGATPDRFSAEWITWSKNLADTTEEGSLNIMLSTLPDQDLGGLCENIAWSFDHGSFSGGYGGKPWGAIARTLARYLQGETSAEAFIDTAYTLAHNNGPMFNKGMIYLGYTGYFLMVLDLQRSGQICEALIDNTLESRYTGSFHHLKKKSFESLLKTVADAKQQGIEFGQYVDWFKVESLGSVQKYTKEKLEQKKKYGVQEKILIDGQPATVSGEFKIAPNQTVNIYKRMKVAA